MDKPQKQIHFNKNLVNRLYNKLSDEVINLGINFPNNVYGHIRFDNDILTSIYLGAEINNNSIYDKRSILKYDYNDDFIFKGIYLKKYINNIEHRYDINMKLNSMYEFNNNNINSYEDQCTDLLCTKIWDNGKAVDIPYYKLAKKDFKKHLKQLEDDNIIINNKSIDRYVLDRCFTKDNTLYLTL